MIHWNGTPIAPLGLVAAALALPTAGLSQGTRSGPAAGTAVTPVKVYAATGPHAGKEFDAAAALGQGPGALLFVHEINRETAPLIRSLDEQTAEFALLGFRSFTVVLDGDRTQGEATIKRVSNAVRMRNPMTLSLDGAEGPGNYALARNATLTLVTMKGGQVLESIGFTETGAKDIPRLTQAIEAVAGKLPKSLEARAKLLPDDPAALKKMIAAQWLEVRRLRRQLENTRQRNQRQRMGARRGAERPGTRPPGKEQPKKKLPGAIPEDAELTGLLRRLIRVKTKAEIDALFTAIEASIDGKEDRRTAMLLGFERILGATTYGTDEARQRAVDYCKKHGKVVEVRKKD